MEHAEVLETVNRHLEDTTEGIERISTMLMDLQRKHDEVIDLIRQLSDGTEHGHDANTAPDCSYVPF